MDLLIGAEVADYLPHKVKAVGNLVVLESKFGKGYTMVGSHLGIVS